MTTSDRTRSKTITDNIYRYDFVVKHGNNATAQQRQRQDVQLPCAFVLRQAAPSVQWLFSTSEFISTSYTIAPSNRTGFVKKLSHMEIVKHRGGREERIAEFNLKDHEKTTRIMYESAGITQSADLTVLGLDRYRCMINGKAHEWQPLGPSKTVLVMTSEAGKRMALFVYPQVVAQRSGSYSGCSREFAGQDVGTIHIMDICDGGREMLELMLCTGVVLAHRGRRKPTLG